MDIRALARQRAFKTGLLLVLPWLVVLGVPQWRALFGEQISGVLGRPDLHELSDYCLKMQRTDWWESNIEPESAEVEWYAAKMENEAHAGGYARAVSVLPNEAWPRARWLAAIVTDVATRVSNLPDQYDFNQLPPATFPPPSPTSDDALPPALLKPKFLPPQREEQKQVLAIVHWGHIREPGNAYYDIGLACYQVLTGDDNGALKSLSRAARCTYYDPHGYDALAATVHQVQRQRNFSLEAQTQLWWARLKPLPIDPLSLRMGAIAGQQQKQGRHAEALRLLRDASRVGALIAAGRTDHEERLRGRAMQVTVGHYLGGWGDYVAYQRYIFGLSRRTGPEVELWVAARAGAAYARQHGQPGVSGEVLAAAQRTASLALLSGKEQPANIYWQRLQTQRWPWQCFLLWQLAVALPALFLVQLMRGRLNAPQLNLYLPLAPVLLGLACSAGLEILFRIPQVQRAIDDNIYMWVERLVPDMLVVLWWLIVGMWRCLQPPTDGIQMNSGEQWPVWRAFTLALRLAPGIVGGLLTVLFLWMEAEPFRFPGGVLKDLTGLGAGGPSDTVHWLAIGSSVLMSLYGLFFLAKWRWFSPESIRAEVGRSLGGMSRSLILTLILTGWAYSALNIAFISTEVQLARALDDIHRNGYPGTGWE